MRALVVDDATTVRRFHRAILEEAGFFVEEAMNGVEAIERSLAAEPPPDLLLVDANMPRMDGYALLRRLRANPALCDIPAIMISTERHGDASHRAFAAGANLFLIKPVQPARLTRLSRALVGYRPECQS
jgi:two-component system chemotaxis response regulator CheY